MSLSKTAETGKVVVQGGSPILLVLFLVLLIGKLAGVPYLATLSWWLVFLPIYIGPAVVLAILVICALVAIVWGLFAVLFGGKK